MFGGVKVASVDPLSRSIGVSVPLGKDLLLLQSMTAREELGRLFRLDLELRSKERSIDIDQVIGQPITLRLGMQDRRTRFWNGIVSEFAQVTHSSRESLYRATVRPWFWWLTRTSDCRIFQDLSVPEIVERVFEENGFTDYAIRLSGTYRTWPYCAQYRETDFDFLSRLLEQEGLYYYFVHEADRHILVLADGVGSHDRAEGYEKVPYLPADRSPHATREHINRWLLRRAVQSGKCALRDFDFASPGDSLDADRAITRPHVGAGYEVFDYPGEYRDVADGQNYAKVRIQELQSGYERVEGGATARGLLAGAVFDLTDFPRDDQNRPYLIVSTTTRLAAAGQDGGRESGPAFDVTLEAMHTKEQFRLARTTPRPVVQGPQTAIVTGPAGEEIWTDEFGRIKVQFHWDRYGQSDGNSSCWLRVAQSLAGQAWGSIMIPRKGQEVIVTFLEGDPDRPLVTGCLYNGENTPPYALPDNKTRSGIRTRSSPEGDGAAAANELRFEDKAGSEEMYLHAAKDQTIVVQNDRHESVGHDAVVTVNNDRSKSVGGGQSESIGGDKATQVGGDQYEAIGGDMEIQVGGDQSETIGGDKATGVGGDQTEAIGGDKATGVGGDQSEAIGKSRVVEVSKNYLEEVGKKRTLLAKSVRIEAADEITLVTGKASITMKKNGDISITGKRININGSDKVVIKGKKIVEK